MSALGSNWIQMHHQKDKKLNKKISNNLFQMYWDFKNTEKTSNGFFIYAKFFSFIFIYFFSLYFFTAPPGSGSETNH